VQHLDRPLYIVGYLPKDNRLYMIDRDCSIVSFQLLLSVIEYQTAVVRRDFEAAATWFDCAHALSGMPCDLLSAANMRAKLAKTSAVALAAYLHVLSLAQTGTPPSESELSMATAKRSALEQARAQRGPVAGGADGNREYF